MPIRRASAVVGDIQGFCSNSLLVDRRTGHCAGSVVFESRGAMEHSRDQFTTLREDFARKMGLFTTQREESARKIGPEILEVAEFDPALRTYGFRNRLNRTGRCSRASGCTDRAFRRRIPGASSAAGPRRADRWIGVAIAVVIARPVESSKSGPRPRVPRARVRGAAAEGSPGGLNASVYLRV